MIFTTAWICALALVWVRIRFVWISEVVYCIMILIMDCYIDFVFALEQIPETVSSTVQTVPQSMCEIGTQFSYLVPMAGIHIRND